MRDPRHYMPLNEFRCTSDLCPRRTECLRRVAPIAQGSPVGDGFVIAQTNTLWPQIDCVDFIKHGHFTPPDPVAPARRVHKPIGGS